MFVVCTYALVLKDAMRCRQGKKFATKFWMQNSISQERKERERAMEMLALATSKTE